MSETALLSAEQVVAGHGAVAVVSGLEIAIGSGDGIAVTGPNGAGKTTVVRTLLGLLPPLEGRIRRAPGVRAALVPQRDSVDPLFPFPAADVVDMAVRRDAWWPLAARADRRRRVAEALERVDATRVAGIPWRDLSGGQRQRVLIARALAAGPGLLVLDEPTAGLDAANDARIRGLLRELRERDGLALLLVTHDRSVIGGVCPRELAIDAGRASLSTAGAAS